MIDLGDVPGGATSGDARGISADGGVLVGRGTAGAQSELGATVWVEGVPRMIAPSGADAFGISPDGHYVLGRAPDGMAMRWDLDGNATVLGALTPLFPSPNAYAYASSFDGSVVVGESRIDTFNHAFIWDAAHGIRDLRDVLVSEYGLGQQLQGWVLNSATDVSWDGQAITGYGVNPQGQREAWAVSLSGTHVPEPASAVVLLVSAALFAGRRRPRPSRL